MPNNNLTTNSTCTVEDQPYIYPETTSPFCVVVNAGNQSAILESCCEGAPVSVYDDMQLAKPACFVYCNVSSSAWNGSVWDCLGEKGIGRVACGAGKKSSAATRIAGEVGGKGRRTAVWLLGYLMVSWVFMC